MSARIIPLFVEDEFTGLKVANRPMPETFIVVNSSGKGVRCFRQRWQALNWINQQRDCYNLHIIKVPGSSIEVRN